MKVEQAKQIASNAIEQLRKALEAGQSEKLTEYLAAMARFRRYSLHNVMLIASQEPNATHVAGFHAWHKLGRFVKKDEKGILILAPIIRQKAENNAETEPDESSVAIGFRAAYVFDISQTDGQPLPEIGSINGDPRGYRDGLGSSSPRRASRLNIPTISRRRAASQKAARSRCCRPSPRLRNSPISLMRSRTRSCTVTSAAAASRSASARPKPKQLRSLFAAQSASKRDQPRKTTSVCTAAMQSF